VDFVKRISSLNERVSLKLRPFSATANNSCSCWCLQY